MNTKFEQLKPWLDKAYALSSALTLFEWDDAGVTIIGYKGTKTDLVIEPIYTVDGVKYPVKTIAESAFETNKNIKKSIDSIVR